MDPFFFLTKHKNFIPHEYPCRTEFAAERRGKRPQPQGAFEADRVWLPFDSPRVDLSGFWFRPTVIGTWARTGSSRPRRRPGAAQAAHLRRRRAVRQRNRGRLDGALWTQSRSRAGIRGRAGCRRQRDPHLVRRSRRARRPLFLPVGLCSSGPGGRTCDADHRDGRRSPTAMEGALEAMRFERPAYGDGEVALVTDVQLPVAMDVSVAIEGDFMSIEKPVTFALKLKAGASRMPIAAAEELPADFRHFKVSLTSCGFTAQPCLRRRDLPCRPPGHGPGRACRSYRRGAGRSRRLRRGRYGARAGAAGDADAPARTPTP